MGSRRRPTEVTNRDRTRRSWWDRLADWLGLDRSEPVDMLTVDPVRHFREWDRDLPDRYMG